MPRVKPVVVIMWIAFGLVAMMHGQVEALGDLGDSFCSCLAGVAAMGNSRKSAQPAAACGGAASRWIYCTGNLPQVAIASSGFPRSKRPPTMAAIQAITSDDDLVFLLANWQFWRRTALAPRAPSLRG